MSDITYYIAFCTHIFYTNFDNNSNYVHSIRFDWLCTHWKFSIVFQFLWGEFVLPYTQLTSESSINFVELNVSASFHFKCSSACKRKVKSCKKCKKLTIFHTNVCHNPVYALLRVCKGQLFAVFGQFCFEQNFTVNQNSLVHLYFSVKVHMQLVRTHQRYVMNSINTLWSLTL